MNQLEKALVCAIAIPAAASPQTTGLLCISEARELPLHLRLPAITIKISIQKDKG